MKSRAIALGAVGLLLLAGCQGGNDAPVVDGNESGDQTPAQIIAMPDGFSNVATKCDQYGNRIYTIYHRTADYGSITVVPQDKSCIQAGETGAENAPR